MEKQRKLIRLKELLKRLGNMSKSTAYRKMAAGTLPLPVRLGDNSNAWFDDEIDEVIESLPRVESLGPKPKTPPESVAGPEQPAAA